MKREYKNSLKHLSTQFHEVVEQFFQSFTDLKSNYSGKYTSSISVFNEKLINDRELIQNQFNQIKVMVIPEWNESTEYKAKFDEIGHVKKKNSIKQEMKEDLESIVEINDLTKSIEAIFLNINQDTGLKEDGKYF